MEIRPEFVHGGQFTDKPQRGQMLFFGKKPAPMSLKCCRYDGTTFPHPPLGALKAATGQPFINRGIK